MMPQALPAMSWVSFPSCRNRPRIDDVGDVGFFLDDQRVLRAIRAENSVGSAMASSSALVCSDWAPAGRPLLQPLLGQMVRTRIIDFVGVETGHDAVPQGGQHILAISR